MPREQNKALPAPTAGGPRTPAPGVVGGIGVANVAAIQLGGGNNRFDSPSKTCQCDST